MEIYKVTRLKGNTKAKARRKKRIEKNRRFQIYRFNLLSKIRKFDDPILKEKCKDVDLYIPNLGDKVCNNILYECYGGKINYNEEINNIIKLLGKILINTEDGVGLAASQIGYTVNIFAIRSNLKINNIQFFINPEILEKSEETIYWKEGCLSYPGIFAVITRYKEIKVKYFDENGKEKINNFENQKSVIFQHEFDHLQEGWCKIYDFWKKGKQENTVPVTNI